MARPNMRDRKARLGEHLLPLLLGGLLCWLVAALLVRSLPQIFENRWRLVMVYAASLPLAEIILWAIGLLLGLERALRLHAAVVLAVTVLLLHGLALVWLPAIYGADETTVRHGAAWLVWTLGLTIASARYAARQP